MLLSELKRLRDSVPKRPGYHLIGVQAETIETVIALVEAAQALFDNANPHFRIDECYRPLQKALKPFTEITDTQKGKE